MCLNVQVEVKGKRGKPSVMVTEDEEFKKVNFDKFAKLPTVFQVSGNIFQICKKQVQKLVSSDALAVHYDTLTILFNFSH